MKLDDEVIILLFKNNEGETTVITLTIDQLLDKTRDDLYEMLDNSEPCTCSSCNNESQNFCDCGSKYEDYEIVEVQVSCYNNI